MLRQMFLRSKERNSAMKRDEYSCQKCKKKQSKKQGHEVRVIVHHLKGIGIWDELIDLIYEHLLCDPDELQTLCEDCHDDETYDQ